MTKVTLNMGINTSGRTIYTLQLGDRRIRFGESTAERLLNDWPGRLGSQAALCASGGEPFVINLGGAAVRLTSSEASQLAGLPQQLRNLMDAASRMRAHAASEELTAASAPAADEGPRCARRVEGSC